MSPSEGYVSLSVTFGFLAFGLLLWNIAGTVIYVYLRDELRPSLPLSALMYIICGPLVWILAIARGTSELTDWLIHRSRGQFREETPRDHGVTSHRADRSSA